MTQKVNPNQNPKLIALVGPTASGKTDLSLKLAKRFKGVILSADSRQLYQHAHIGTNQPIGQWRTANKAWQKNIGQQKIYLVQGIPHFFIDELSPNKSYSAALFQKKANRLISKISRLGYLPILVGGTGLYISAITQSYLFPKAKKSTKLRHQLDKLNTSQLNKKLKKLDPATYKIIDQLNRRRLIRALEYVLLTGQSFQKSQNQKIRPHTLILGLNPTLPKLEKQITKRTKQMIKKGLIKETKYLLRHYPSSVLLNTIGYKETVAYLKKQLTLNQVTNLISLHTRQYAKRQLTWFKKMLDITWLNHPNQALKITKTFIT